MSQGQEVGSNAVDTGASAAAVADVPSTTPATAEPQNGQAQSQQAQGAPAEESFSTIDPNTLPPELQKVYKNLQADYTRKTQDVADARKKADAYEQIAKDPRFTSYWNSLNQEQKADFKEQKAEVEKSLGQSITDDEFAKAFESKDTYLAFMEKTVQQLNAKAQKKIEQLEQKVTQSEAADVVETYATEVGQDGKPIRPDFYSYDDDGLISGFMKLNAPEGLPPEKYRDALDAAYTWCKSMTGKYYEKGRQDGLARVQQKAANSSEMATTTAKGTYTGGDPKKLSASEAFALAKKGVRVPQDY